METANIRAPFDKNRTHHRKSFKKHPKWTPNDPQMTPKWNPKSSQNGPEGSPDTEAWTDPEFFAFWPPRSSKTETKKHSKIMKNGFRATFFTPSKNDDFQDSFFAVFQCFGSPKTLKIKPKHCTVCKNRGSALFDKSARFFRKLKQKEPPNALQNVNNT